MREMIHSGGWMNAKVYKIGKWIEKDFSENHWIVRNTVGRMLIRRECRILQRLEKTGLVPKGAQRLSAFAMREEFCHGFTLRDSCCGVHSEYQPGSRSIEGIPQELLDNPPPRKFFETLEAGLKKIHSLGYVHLDMHNERNVIMTLERKPVILDWQSALPLAKVPIIGPMLRRIDLAGIYKFWKRFRPCELDDKRLKILTRTSFFRRHFWVPRIRL